MPADAAVNLSLTFLNSDHDWKRACAVCEQIITKGQEGTQVEKTHLTLGERSLRVYLVWHDDCRERYLEAGETCETP
jgi:hypothetical protein